MINRHSRLQGVKILMQRISGLIGKEAIALAGAARCGTVVNVYFDTGFNKCRYFTLVCDDSDEYKWVAYKSLCSLNNDAIVLKSADCALPRAEGTVVKSPVNLPAFNQDGASLGIVRDIELDGDTAVNLVTDLKTIPINTLLSMSDELLVFNETGTPIKQKRTVKKTAQKTLNSSETKPLKAAQVPVENSLDKTERIPETVAPAIKNRDWLTDREIKTPVKLPPEQTEVYRSPSDNAAAENPLSRYHFLLGKRIQRPIYGKAGQVLAQENALVSEEIIRSAKEHGKLVMLALHSL